MTSIQISCWAHKCDASSTNLVAHGCNRPVCSLLHLELWSGELFPMKPDNSRDFSTHPECKFLRWSTVIQPVMLPFMNNIQECVFQQDNTQPVVTQLALQSVHMLLWPARSQDLSPIQNVRDIIADNSFVIHNKLYCPCIVRDVINLWSGNFNQLNMLRRQMYWRNFISLQ